MAPLRLSGLITALLLLLNCSLLVHQAGSVDPLYMYDLTASSFVKDGQADDSWQASRFSPQLSYLSLVASAAAYASGAVGSCYQNSGLAGTYGPMRNVRQVSVPAYWKTIGGTWSGFVARLPRKRITMIVFRGTNQDGQLIVELLSVLKTPPVPSPVGGRVQAYFSMAQRAVWSKLEPAFAQIRSANPGDAILVTGHSLGGAMAALTAVQLAAKRLRPQMFTFGEPRVGDATFSAAFDKLMAGGSSWRVVNGRDPVVHLPLCRGPLERCQPDQKSGPYHHGTEVFYPSGMRPNSPSGFRICQGKPKNEDRNCADSPKVFLPCLTKMASCIGSHLNYYGIKVSKWWSSSQCKPKKESDEKIMGRLLMESVINS
ncbi:hypothetical protein BOX15_Mlig013567g1 [Macrostomum lignano]|uniref:Uncharacterized protein n=2 Tax=Macrostomum lignano TaxID=282301 RepID=A0A267F7A8_9PLAT|nr:hypothetical protein BOX15_Mlig013567g1 [Macrostomum lignano]